MDNILCDEFFSDMSQFDFDALTSSCVDTNVPPTTDGNNPSNCPLSGMLDTQDWGGQAAFSATTNEDIKQILQGISIRLEEVEKEVSRGNHQIGQIGFNVDVHLPKLLVMMEDFGGAIQGLRSSLKVFTRGLLKHLLGCQVEGDIEAGPDM